MPTKNIQAKNEGKSTKAASFSSYAAELSKSCCNPSKEGCSTKKTASSSQAKSQTSPSKQKKCVTRITVQYDAGFPNQLYIRGQGCHLSWDKGQLLKNTKADEWIWESEEECTDGEFKIVLNDEKYEEGENHFFKKGANIVYTPHFS